MKKRLFERRRKKQDIFILIIHMMMIYILMSWDLFFGDVFALAPGYMLTVIVLMVKKVPILMILATFYAILWSLLYPTFLWLSPVFFILFCLLSLLYNRRRKSIKGWFFVFYGLEFFFCFVFYNQWQLQNTQFIQIGLYFIVFFHIKIHQKT